MIQVHIYLQVTKMVHFKELHEKGFVYLCLLDRVEDDAAFGTRLIISQSLCRTKGEPTMVDKK